jgi:hypothetical protein
VYYPPAGPQKTDLPRKTFLLHVQLLCPQRKILFVYSNTTTSDMNVNPVICYT